MNRIVIGGVGLLVLGYAAWLALSSLGLGSVRLALWLTGLVLVHDGLLVPLVLALAWAARRALPRPDWGPAAAGFIVAGTLTALSAVVLIRSGRGSSTPGLLDRDYPLGYGAALLVVLILTAAGIAVLRRSTRPTHQVVAPVPPGADEPDDVRSTP